MASENIEPVIRVGAPGQTLAIRITKICATLWPNGDGFYVEAGANDGIQQSNTLELENAGWRGLLIEPSPSAFAQLLQNRPRSFCENKALVSDSAIEELYGTFSTGNLMGTANPSLMLRNTKPRLWTPEHWRRKVGIKPRIPTSKVPATTLNDLLKAHEIRSVDLLVLDVEGFEIEALIGMKEYRPRVLIVETRTWDFFAMAQLLFTMGYVLVNDLSKFNPVDNPGWSRDHQDLCWIQASDFEAIQAISQF